MLLPRVQSPPCRLPRLSFSGRSLLGKLSPATRTLGPGRRHPRAGRGIARGRVERLRCGINRRRLIREPTGTAPFGYVDHAAPFHRGVHHAVHECRWNEQSSTDPDRRELVRRNRPIQRHRRQPEESAPPPYRSGTLWATHSLSQRRPSFPQNSDRVVQDASRSPARQTRRPTRHHRGRSAADHATRSPSMIAGREHNNLVSRGGPPGSLLETR